MNRAATESDLKGQSIEVLNMGEEAVVSKTARVVGEVQVHFATGSATLAGDSQAVLDQASQALKDNPSWHMRVIGHTDSVGSDASNHQLAQNRAEGVKAYLVSHGVNASTLDTVEKGSTQPADTNSTDSGKAANRRVELVRK